MPSRAIIFSAVFPSAAPASLPTPKSTPLIGIGSFHSSSFAEEVDDVATEKIRWERAWHAATSFLSLPNRSITPTVAAQSEMAIRKQWLKPYADEVSTSIGYLVAEDSLGWRLRQARKEDHLVAWYAQEVERHYVAFQLPQLRQILELEDDEVALSNVLKLLRVSQAVYLHPFRQHVLPKLVSDAHFQLLNFQESHHALVAVSLRESSFWSHLTSFLQKQTAVVFAPHLQQENVAVEAQAIAEHQQEIAEAQSKTVTLTEAADEVGLGGSEGQRVFAEVMSAALTDHVNTTCAGQWTKGSPWIGRLREWVQDDFASFAVEVLSSLKGDADPQLRKSPVTLSDVRSWQERAITDLGLLRLRELFDIIVDWSGDTSGGIEDLKHYITTAATRTHLVTHFSAVLSYRLLQPGASTTHILQVYVSIIRAFAMLDPNGVLIDRLARPIRRYLRDREDTVGIIVSGLLADSDDDATDTDALVELAAEVRKSSASIEENDDDVDWDNMDWRPYPIDAGPNFQKSKSADVIGSLISLFESKDIFVKEFQNHLGERLLRSGNDFEREIRVLELLKVRFGESLLQACEVMLQDIKDSHRTDHHVKEERVLADGGPNLSAKILSRLFWPSLHSDTFAVPPDIAAIQERYAAAFENHKHSRKLTWLPALGQVSVELQLEDRTVPATVQTWQASVIYAFQDANAAQTISRTVEELSQYLRMDINLVRNALTFWIGKLVLIESSPGIYTVLERLATTDTTTISKDPARGSLATAAATAAAASAMGTSALRSADDMVNEKMEIFWQYIVGMLTNQGQMPLPRIVMMLSLVVPGGFPFGNDELREYLAGKVAQGKVELTAGNYKVIKGVV